MSFSQATEVVLGRGASSAVVPASLVDAATGYIAQARSPNTVKAYNSDWRAFNRWCEQHGLSALPAAPQTLCLYFAHRAEDGAKPATLDRALSAISQAHKRSGYASPRSGPVLETLKGIKRHRGSAQRQAKPLVVGKLKKAVQALPSNLRGHRNRPILCLGFAGALRRSEIVGLDVTDLELTEEGLRLRLRCSKGDTNGRGVTIGIPYGAYLETCPVRSVTRWLDTSGLTEGPLFVGMKRNDALGEKRLCGKDIARIVKRAVQRIGLSGDDFSGHSLRSGLATSAARAGKRDQTIMRQGRWRSRAVMDRYVREGTLFGDNAAAGIGL